ncbi:MAG: undecaprenyl-phosphate glucose phosphotransferase [Chloroflexi bacterium]|nr:undecaprenyl-phosphate glucose phosphotransferase [Chloroflexota bacterium]
MADRSLSRARRVWRYLKPLADMLLIFFSFVIAYWLRYELQWIRQVEPAYLVPFDVYLPSVVALMGILVIVYWIEGAYRPARGRTLFDELWIVLRGTLIGIAAMIVIVFLVTPSYYSRLIFGYAGFVIFTLLSLSRTIERAIAVRLRRRGVGVRRVLLVGSGEVARSVMRAVVARPELGYQIVGFVDDEPESLGNIGRYPALGSTARLPEILRGQTVDEVIIALPWVSSQKIAAIAQQCEREGVRANIVPDLFQMTLSRVAVDNLDGIPLLSVREPSLRDWQVVFKRVMDVVVAGLGLILLSPVLLLTALAIRLDSPGPIIFRQTRVGRGGQEFTCFKFRTMCVDAEQRLEELRPHNEANGPWFKMRNDPRRTRVGRFLRRTSLDELPQLWNVLKGEMSLIGPRPNLPSEVQAYEPWHYRRLEIAPGITGLWQVSGRSELTFDEMVLLDVYYIENWSPILDLHILLKTIPTVILGSGAY